MDLFSYAEQIREDEREIKGEDRIAELLRSGNIETGSRFNLRNEAFILRLAYAYNKILSLSNSRTRILAHQVESTHRIVNAVNHRFLIADEVGLGKTVEAGLVVKELIYRYGCRRILIVCPASLLYQWQSEMQNKFNERFEIMNRSLLQKAAAQSGGRNPWSVYDRLICSVDFIKNPSFAGDLSAVRWDAAIFDEAHRLRRDETSSTLAYNAAERIAANAEALLLLSATPFRGKLEELYYLIYLIDKNILGPFRSFHTEYCTEGADTSSLKKKLSEVLIRRTKRDIGGFTRRYAKTIRFELYEDERLLYEETTKYVAEEFNRALQTENRAVGFVMTVFQKLLDSSSFALMTALRRRKERIEDIITHMEKAGKIKYDHGFTEAAYREQAGYEEAEEDCLLLSEHTQKTLEELKTEASVIAKLIAIAEGIEKNKKSEKLTELIASLKKKKNNKLLIFTQFRTTQDYLASALSEYKVVLFNGSMSGQEKEQAVSDFKNHADIMIATEAGGEGRNLQFCSILINYDLPWSPLKVEQRIGRIHRFGQTRDVLIYNFSTADTVAERVLDVLDRKLKLFEDSIGSPDIILGEIEDELKLNTLFMEYALGRRKKQEVEHEIEERVSAARENYRKLEELTVSDRMDFNYDEYYRITMKERQFSNRRIERFVNKLQDEDDFCDSLLSSKKTASGLYKLMEGEGRYGTFDSQTALDREELDFLAFGHPVIDNLMEHAVSPDFGGYTGVKTISFGRPCIGLLCCYIVSFRSVRETKEFIPVVAPITEGLSETELEEIERNAFEFGGGCDAARLREIHRTALPKIDSLIASARERLNAKISKRLADMSDEIDFNIDPQLEKIRISYDKTIKELEEKLELQRSRMKWYGSDLRSVITRTSNKIMKAKQEKERLLSEYRGYLGIEASAEMASAGFIIGLNTTRK